MPKEMEEALKRKAGEMAAKGKLRRKAGESLKAAQERFVYGTMYNMKKRGKMK